MTYSSKEAYDAAVATGLISKSRAKVLLFLALHGPSTARQIFEGTGMFPGSVTPRLAELESQGMVIRQGFSQGGPLDTHSQMWAFTPGMPRPWKPRSTGLPARVKVEVYEPVLRQIAATPCNCGGPKTSLFSIHLPGCMTDHPFVILCCNALDRARAL